MGFGLLIVVLNWIGLTGFIRSIWSEVDGDCLECSGSSESRDETGVRFVCESICFASRVNAPVFLASLNPGEGEPARSEMKGEERK